jgi:hypothetical protein
MIKELFEKFVYRTFSRYLSMLQITTTFLVRVVVGIYDRINDATKDNLGK